MDKERSYYYLTDTTVNTDNIIVNTSNVNVLQDTETINNIFKNNRYFTPKSFFESYYFLENNDHSIGKTLTAHIESLLATNKPKFYLSLFNLGIRRTSTTTTTIN